MSASTAERVSPRFSVARSHLQAIVRSLEPGERIPPERELASEWGMSRMTVRKAIESLQSKGLLNSRHGSGTFVTDPSITRELGLSSLSADLHARGLLPENLTMSFGTVAAEPRVARGLRLQSPQTVTRFVRLRSASGVPIALETTWIPAALVPRLSIADLDGSLLATLSSRFSLVAATVDTVVGATIASARIAELLDVEPGSACLAVGETHLLATGRPFMLTSSVYRGDRYQLRAGITAPAGRTQVQS